MNDLTKYIFFSISLYLLFFWKLILPDYFFWGSDAQTKFLPVRVYFYERVTQNLEFPFWTERIFSGFPIFADPEHSYLHPINIVSILLFGPILSYKILHFGYYLLGSICFYMFLKKKGVSLLGAATANLIFYFNVFMLNHQVHFTIIMSLYLLPVAFLLIEKFLETRKFIFVFLQSLVFINAVLWGHLQSAVIMFIGIFLYLCIFGYKKIPLKSFILYTFFVPLLTLLVSLPQILPTYDLYEKSYREDGFDFRFGTFSRSLLLTSFVPYLLGNQTDNSFIGDTVGVSVTYTEMYFYFGISTLLIFIFTFFVQKTNKDLVFAYSSLILFLIFSFIGYIDIIFDSFPFISMFRYWVRFVIVLIFGISILIAKYISNLDYEFSKRSLLRGISALVGIVLFIQLIFFITLDEDKYLGLYSLFSPSYLKNDYKFIFEFLALIFLTLMSLFLLSVIKNKHKSWAFLILSLVIFLDLYYFSKDVLDFRIRNYTTDLNVSAQYNFPNTRVIDSGLNISGNEFLYLKSYSPFGYSQLKEKDYVRETLEAGIFNITGDKDPITNKDALRELGIQIYISSEGKVNQIFNQTIFPFKTKFSYTDLKTSESMYEFQVDNRDEKNIETFLKYDPDWVVKLNGNRIITLENDLKLNFTLPKGLGIVNIYYFPTKFYIGLAVSLFTLFVTLGMIYKKKNQKL